jgi:hypothetical protein
MVQTTDRRSAPLLECNVCCRAFLPKECVLTSTDTAVTCPYCGAHYLPMQPGHLQGLLSLEQVPQAA